MGHRRLGSAVVGNPGHEFLRDADAEAKILEAMLDLTTPETRGTLRLYSEREICPSGYQEMAVGVESGPAVDSSIQTVHCNHREGNEVYRSFTPRAPHMKAACCFGLACSG